jgi:hypothetical protein
VIRTHRDRKYRYDRCSEIRLGDDGTCELETRRQVIRLHVNEIRSVLYWPESDETGEHYTLYYQGGELQLNKGMEGFNDFLRRLKRLNPAVDPSSSSFPYGARSAFRRQLTDRSSTQFHESWLFALLVGCLLVYLLSHY